MVVTPGAHPARPPMATSGWGPSVLGARPGPPSTATGATAVRSSGRQLSHTSPSASSSGARPIRAEGDGGRCRAQPNITARLRFDAGGEHYGGHGPTTARPAARESAEGRGVPGGRRGVTGYQCERRERTSRLAEEGGDSEGSVERRGRRPARSCVGPCQLSEVGASHWPIAGRITRRRESRPDE